MMKKSFAFVCIVLMISLCLSVNSLSLNLDGDTCGVNVWYTYNSKADSVQIIGQGDMKNYKEGAASPFYDLNNPITSVVITDGVTSIGDNSFFGCEYLENITIADSVTYIGKNAFEGCFSLAGIIIPKGVSDIYSSTFAYCSDLKSVVFLGEINSIAPDAFTDCTLLSLVHFKGSIDNLSSAVIASIPTEAEVHGTSYGVTVRDCLSGETVISLYCESCEEYIYINESIEKYNSHNYSAYKSNNDYTCIAAGTKTATCDRCGKTDTVADEDSATGHRWSDWCVTSAATCTKDGTSARICSACGELENKIIPAIEHINSYTVASVAPSCTTVGYTGGTYCPDCKAWLSGHTEIPSIGHSGGTATCTRRAVCVKCSKGYGNLNSNNHINVVVTPGTAAKCTVNGYTESKQCNDCKKIIQARQTVDALGHTEVQIPAKGAGCLTSGYTAGSKCSVCNTTIKKSEVIPAKGHKEINISGREATCTQSGLTGGKKCSTCGMVTVPQKKISAKNHNYTVVTVKKATLKSNGKTEQKCSCGKVKPGSAIIVYSPKTVSLSAETYTYNASIKTPSVTVKDSKGVSLKENTDYVVKYESGRKAPGKYTVTVTFTGVYSGSKNLYFTIAPKATNKISASQTASTITLKWNNVTGVDGYRVYKYNVKTKKYEKLKDVTSRTLTVKNLKSGTTYKFKVKAYKKDGSIIWGSASVAYAFSTKPDAPSKISCSKTSSTVILKWNKVSGADGYAVYRYYSSGWKRIESLNSGSKTKLKIQNLKSGTYYKFRIVSLKNIGDTQLSSSPSEAVSVLTDPGVPSLKVTSGKKGIVLLKWSNVSGENGYQIYFSTKKDGNFKIFAATKADVVKISKENLNSGATYYFKIRSYKKTTSGTLYSEWSTVSVVKVK